MGWLFGKKKTPKVPLPEGHLDDKALYFPRASTAKTIIPDYHEDSPAPPTIAPPVSSPLSRSISARDDSQSSASRLPSHRHHYVKVEAYEQITSDLDALKKDLGHLGEINRLLETSEFNEESDYDKIKKSLKQVHDKLVSMDKTLFTERN